MIQGLKDKAFPTVPASMDELSMALCSKPIIVLGGLYPGHSTNATAALVAEKSNACLFINATDVDGVYSDDPRINKKAKKFDQIDTKSLFDLISKSPMSAGAYDLMDPLSVKIIERSRIKTRVILCTPENILAATKGHHIGTEIIVRE
jgi:uridylate kinase